MTLRFLSLSILLVFLGCATAPPPGKPLVVLAPAYVSPTLAGGPVLGTQFQGWVAQALRASGRYGVRTKGFFEGGYDEALARLSYPKTADLGQGDRETLAAALKVGAIGLTDLVADESGRNLRAHVRIVDATTGAVVESYLLYLPGQDPATWASVVQDRLATAQFPGPRGQSPRLDTSGLWESGWALAPGGEGSGWRSALERARSSGDFDEALRLVDLVLDATRNPTDKDWSAVRDRLRKVILTEGLWAREDGDVAELTAVLSAPRGTVAEEERFLPLFLDRVRATVPTSGASLRKEVVDGFRERFGLDLGRMLTQPSLAIVEGGTFSMGSNQGEADEKPVHQVTVPAFLMARTEVTQEQYTAVTGFNPSLFTQTATAPRQPVERVTWYDAVEFCNKLSVRDGLDPVYTLVKRNPATGYPIKTAEVTQDRTKDGYRLPTEAEWEWAARGGVLSGGHLLAGGDDPALVAWTDGSTAGPGPVGTRHPNELGLFDLSGNVWEWCSDWYGRYEAVPVEDPVGADLGILKVGRGGSWHAAAWNARVTTRSYDNPGSRGNNIGFRVVRTLTPP